MPEVRLAPGTIARATRAKTLPLVLGPVLVGAAIGEDASSHGFAEVPFPWQNLLLALAGAGALHLAANLLNDVFDARTGADRMARIDRAGILTASGVIDDGKATSRALMTIAATLFAVAFACGAILAARLPDAAAVWWLGAAGAFLAVSYAGPPLRYGYVGHGLGELGFLLAYGYLPAVLGFLAVTGSITSDARWAGLVPGLLTTMALTSHNLLHHRADKAVNKRTPAVVWGEGGALFLVGALGVVAYTALVLQIAAGLFPVYALVAVLTALPLAAAWSRAFADPSPQRCLHLFGAGLGATAVTGLVLAVSAAFA